jgi:hypothetical protein
MRITTNACPIVNYLGVGPTEEWNAVNSSTTFKDCRWLEGTKALSARLVSFKLSMKVRRECCVLWHTINTPHLAAIPFATRLMLLHEAEAWELTPP